MKTFVFDAARCNGCFNCQIACKDEHCGNDWMPYALPQPDMGHFWCKVDQFTHGQIPKVKLEYKVRMCNHCENPACMQAAPDAVYRRDDGLVVIDPAKAKGRKDLVDACPYGEIFWNAEAGVPQKCTGCAHLVDAGELPRCVDACPTGALRYVEEGEVEPGAKAIGLPADAGAAPRMRYVNVPGLFVSGDVWDKEANELVEGARVTLTPQSGEALSTSTDDLGDFWFRNLEAGVYDLHVEHDGYQPQDMRGIKLDKSLNLGDFPLLKRQ